MFLLHNLILLYEILNRLNSTHYFILKNPSKQELQQTALVIDPTLTSDSPLRFRKNLSERI